MNKSVQFTTFFKVSHGGLQLYFIFHTACLAELQLLAESITYPDTKYNPG